MRSSPAHIKKEPRTIAGGAEGQRQRQCDDGIELRPIRERPSVHRSTWTELRRRLERHRRGICGRRHARGTARNISGPLPPEHGDAAQRVEILPGDPLRVLQPDLVGLGMTAGCAVLLHSRQAGIGEAGLKRCQPAFEIDLQAQMVEANGP